MEYFFLNKSSDISVLRVKLIYFQTVRRYISNVTQNHEMGSLISFLGGITMCGIFGLRRSSSDSSAGLYIGSSSIIFLGIS